MLVWKSRVPVSVGSRQWRLMKSTVARSRTGKPDDSFTSTEMTLPASSPVSTRTTVPCSPVCSAMGGYGGSGRSPPAPVLESEPICTGATCGAEASAASATSVPAVGTPKLTFGAFGRATRTRGWLFGCACSGFRRAIACGGSTAGWTTTGTSSRMGGTGLMAMTPCRAPRMPISRNRMQTEFTQASLRSGSRRAVDRHNRASSSFNS